MTERHEKGRTCLKEKQPAGQIDFAEGSVRRKTLALAAPMLIAQVLNLLYNIVDRIYIGKIPGEGTAALAGLGLCFPVVTIVTAFANLFGAGGGLIHRDVIKLQAHDIQFHVQAYLTNLEFIYHLSTYFRICPRNFGFNFPARCFTYGRFCINCYESEA